jgi:hypothetical protein
MKFPHAGHTSTAEQGDQRRESIQGEEETKDSDEEETKDSDEDEPEDPWHTDEGPLAFVI